MKHDRIFVGMRCRICGIELFRSIARLLRLSIAVAVFSMSVAILHADTIGQQLGDAERAYRRGNYQLAEKSLRPVKNSVERLPLQDQLIYWDLLANIEDASGKFADAENAAARHLTLVKQASTAAPDGEVNPECQSLVRLAKIKRELSQLKDACRLYRLALQIPRSDQANDHLWEAATRFELARSLEQLPQTGEAVREFDSASRAAEAAILKPDNAKLGTDEFLRAITLIREAFSAQDKAGPKRQADKSLTYLNKALNAGKVTRQFRIELLISAAACYRQIGDSEKSGTDEQKAIRNREWRILVQVLGNTKDQPSTLDLVARADATLRLAELADSLEPASLKPDDRKSTEFYQQAAGLYDQIQKGAAKRRLSLERGEKREQTAVSENNSEPSIAEEVECLMRLQLIYTRLSKWDDAIQSTEMLRKLRADSLSSDDPNYYRTLSALGSLYAMKVRSDQTPSTPELQNATNSRKDIQTARDYLAKAVEFWQRYEPRSTSELSSALSSYAEVCRDAGDFQRADDLLNETVKYEPTHKRDAAAERQWAEFHLNWGVVQAAVGHFVLADRNYDKARDLVKDTNGADIRERHQLLALIYINKAQLEKSQRHLHEAREYIDIAWNAAQAADFTDDQLVPFKLSNASLLIAEVDAEPQSVQQVSSGPKKPVPVDIKSNLDKAVLMTSEILNAAEPYLTTARHIEALAHYRMFERCGADQAELQHAMVLWNKNIATSPDAPQIPALQVRALNYLVEIALHDVKEKREQALILVKSDVPNDQKESIGKRVNDLIQQSDDQRINADKWSKRAQDLAKGSVAYPSVRVQALLGRAHVLRLESQIHTKKAAKLQDSEAVRELKLADQDKSGAIQVLYDAIGVIEMPRAMAAGADVERAAYFAQFSPIFDLLVDLLVEQGKYPEALEVAELRRSRTYQDQLQTSGVDLYATADAEKVEAAKQARNRYYTTLATLQDHWSNRDSRERISSDLATLREKLVKTENEAKATSVFKRQLILDQHSSGRPIVDGVKWVRQQIGDDVALLYYVGNEKSYVFACNRTFERGVIGFPLKVTVQQATKCALPLPSAGNGVDANERPLQASDVVGLVRNMRDLLAQTMKAQRGGSTRRGNDDGLQLVRSGTFDVSSEPFVTDVLLPPDLRKQIAACGAKHVIVVPDGALHQLPLELLPCDPARTKYLLDILPPMCYAPSLYIYRTLQNEQTARAAQLTLVSLANPRYTAKSNANDLLADDDLSSVGKEYEYLNRAGRFERLTFSDEESKQVRAAFGGIGPEKTRVISLLDADASEAKLRQYLKDPSVNFLHLATHGVTEQKYNNLFGALVLATPAQLSSNDDGFLSLYEVYELNLRNCELAVLSACETNCGPDSPLEAGSTMARAFICAGSRRVVCSHWDVSDQATSPLVGQFMKEVADDFRDKSTVDYAAALHAAKKSLRNNSNFSEPWLWAPFVLIGPPTGSSAGGQRTTITAQNN